MTIVPMICAQTASGTTYHVKAQGTDWVALCGAELEPVAIRDRFEVDDDDRCGRPACASSFAEVDEARTRITAERKKRDEVDAERDRVERLRLERERTERDAPSAAE